MNGTIATLATIAEKQLKQGNTYTYEGKYFSINIIVVENNRLLGTAFVGDKEYGNFQLASVEESWGISTCRDLISTMFDIIEVWGGRMSEMLIDIKKVNKF